MYRKIEMASAVLLLLGIVLLVGIASVSRAVGSPIIWSVEIAQLLFVWLCMLAADIALQDGRHFGLLILLDNLSPNIRRLFEIFNLVVLMALLLLLFTYAWKNAILMHPRLIGATQMHASLVHASMVVGLALLMRTMGIQLFNKIRQKADI
ncbi:MAG: C4-dicarboxylate ABC transporter permease [Hyphomicrobiales bacterium]|nr:MAG: C4-dicarboxylate ABC transporter permease [Hyphomicrobiales bacterium]